MEAVRALVNDTFHGEPRPDLVPALIVALSDPDPGVRCFASTSFMNIAANGTDISEAIPTLSRALSEPYWEIRTNAAGALANASHIPAARLALMNALSNTDKNDGVRSSAATALCIRGPTNHADLKMLVKAARKAKEEGKPIGVFMRVHSAWSERLSAQAKSIIADKKFPVPKVGKQDKPERILRVRRLG
jgi:hypothetical protein